MRSDGYACPYLYILCTVCKKYTEVNNNIMKTKTTVTLFSGPKHCSASYLRNSRNLSLQNSTSCLHWSIFFVSEYNN